MARPNLNSSLSPSDTLYASPVSLTAPTIPDPSSSTYDASRNSRQASFALSPVSDTLRRPSSFSRFSSRMSSRGSSSGISTPQGRKRKPGSGLAPSGPARAGTPGASALIDKGDWAHMDADEVFRQLPVGEVKKVEDKLRKEAESKQGELRSMVGTRYRDLLTSTSQITALRESSLRLSDGLKTVVQACSSSTDLNASGSDKADESPETEDIMNLLPVAAHVKLLLDAPEALYAYLSQQAYLKAAFMWLITRVVREGLTTMTDALSETYEPLVEKQWEILQPLRQQISQRASASLRRTDAVDPAYLAETLLALMLLDNHSLDDVLDLFLSQRSKAIRNLLAQFDGSSSARRLSTSRKGRRRASSAARGVHERQVVQTALANAAKAFLDTVALTRAVFDTPKRITDKESLLQEMVRLVQTGEPTVVNPAPTPTRTTSHHLRRTSRLVSMSMNLPTVNLPANAKPPPISARQILSTLPSSQILLRHLPVAVTGFTPFIGPSSAPDLAAKLQNWARTATALMEEAVPAWLAGLSSVTDIWAVRAGLREVLADSEIGETIRRALEESWSVRIQAVWADKLESLLETAKTKVSDAVQAIQASPEDADSHPETFVFSEIAFPPVPTLTFSGPLASSSFASFMSTLKKRSALRTPQLDTVLVALEDAATDLKADMQGLPGALYDDYKERLLDMLERLVRALEGLLEATNAEGKAESEAHVPLFIGRTALHLAKSSTFLRDVIGESDAQVATTEESLLQLYSRSTREWRQRSIAAALVLLQPVFEPDNGPEEVKASWQGPLPVGPSAQVTASVHSLALACRDLGIPPGVNLPVVEEMVQAYVEEATVLPGWSEVQAEAAAQAMVDLAFLDVLAGRPASQAADQSKLLTRSPDNLQADLQAKLPELVSDSLRRMQLLLGPLVAHLPPDVLLPSTRTTSAVDTRGNLLRFGAPAEAKGGVGTEFRSPVAVARPGKRFGLLSIAA